MSMERSGGPLQKLIRLNSEGNYPKEIYMVEIKIRGGWVGRIGVGWSGKVEGGWG